MACSKGRKYNCGWRPFWIPVTSSSDSYKLEEKLKETENQSSAEEDEQNKKAENKIETAAEDENTTMDEDEKV